MIQTIYGDTTSFSGAVGISPGTTYGSVFSTRFDVDYYSFSCSTSEIYFFSVGDGLNVFVNAYGGANYPYSAVARSDVSGSAGTAFMIGNNVLATAGHCALDGNHVPTSFGSNTYRFGANAFGSQLTAGNPAIIYVSPQYAKSNASYPSMYDWALVILDSNCGIDAGYLSIDGPTINSQLGAGDMLIIDGYRGGAQYQTLSYGEFQSYDTSYTIQYSHVTQGGQSGSPVFSQEDGRVVGIHTGVGIGTRFFPELFSLSCELISGTTI